jgi:hypothetical protein
VFTLMALTVIHCVGSSMDRRTMFSSICRSIACATDVLNATWLSFSTSPPHWAQPAMQDAMAADRAMRAVNTEAGSRIAEA